MIEPGLGVRALPAAPKFHHLPEGKTAMHQPVEECGVFGIYGHPDASAYTALGLHALQHRGQESAGIVSFDGEHFHSHKALGLVGDTFGSEEVIANLTGHSAIGHNRYSTTGGSEIRNMQPLFAHYAFGGMAIAHNGNLTNAHTIREQLANKGCIFQSSTDTEVFIHLIATSKEANLIDRLKLAMKEAEGAYSLIAMTNRRIIGARDRHGVRPLSIGRIGDIYMLASESVAFDINGAEFVRDVEPGEIVTLDKNGVTSFKPFQQNFERFCIFEHVYFSRPDSLLQGRNVYETRKKIGAELAKENGVDADMVIPVPDSGVPAAIGYSQASGIPFEFGIIRNHYVGRTFIQPSDHIRHLKVKLKHNPNWATVKDKKIILVDDSIVRGTTSRKIVQMLRGVGVAEIHLRVACPPTTGACYYGIDTPDTDQLLAANNTIEEMKDSIGVDSLVFLSIDGLYRAVTGNDRTDDRKYCDACFTGEYPIPLIDFNNKEQKVISFSLIREMYDKIIKS